MNTPSPGQRFLVLVEVDEEQLRQTTENRDSPLTDLITEEINSSPGIAAFDVTPASDESLSTEFDRLKMVSLNALQAIGDYLSDAHDNGFLHEALEEAQFQLETALNVKYEQDQPDELEGDTP